MLILKGFNEELHRVDEISCHQSDISHYYCVQCRLLLDRHDQGQSNILGACPTCHEALHLDNLCSFRKLKIKGSLTLTIQCIPRNHADATKLRKSLSICLLRTTIVSKRVQSSAIKCFTSDDILQVSRAAHSGECGEQQFLMMLGLPIE